MEQSAAQSQYQHSVALVLINSRRDDLVLHLEPWGEQYPMAPKAEYRVVAFGPPGETLMIEYDYGSITVYSWPGSVITLFKDGTQLGPWASSQVSP